MKWKAAILAGLLAVLAGCSPRSEITVINNGILFDGTGAEPVANGLVAFQGETIIFAGSGEDYSIPAGARVLDAQGGMIMPGVIDVHTHNLTKQEPKVLEAEWTRTGVTSVRCLGVEHLRTKEEFQAMHKRFKTSKYALPRIIAAGPIITNYKGGTSALYEVVADGDEAREFSQGLIDAGADQLKVIVSTEADDQVREILAALIEVAHLNDTRVTGDLRRMSVVEAAIELGIDELAHPPLGVLSEELIAAMVEKDIIIVSTFYTWEANASQGNARRFLDAGGLIALGTDYSGAAPGMPMREFTAMKLRGLTEAEILLAATANAAKAMGMEASLGTLEPGKLADIIVVDGNPLMDISAMSNMKYIVADGQVLD